MEFAEDPNKQAQWDAFQRRADLPREELSAVVVQVRNFIEPVFLALADGDAFKKKWPAGGPWKR